MNERVAEFLAARHAKHAVLTHSGAVTAQEQARASHTPGAAFAKVIVVKERDGYVMAIRPATRVLDLNRLKGLIGHGDVRLATVEEIGAVTPGCAPGAIPPFGALFGLRTFVDRALLDATKVTMPAGDFQVSLRMPSREFLRLTGAVVGDFGVLETLLAAGGAHVPRTTTRRQPARGPARRAARPRRGGERAQS
jgi:Ala-tRNA(Pro) deacylase